MQHHLQPAEDGWGASSTSAGSRRQPGTAVLEDALMAMPSFRSFSHGQEGPPLYAHQLDGGETEDEFEFGSASRDSSFDGLEPVDAKDVFSGGCIRPVYPLFRQGALVSDDGDGDCNSSADAIRLADDAIDFCLSFRDFKTSDEGSTSTSSSASSSRPWESPDDVDSLPAERFSVPSPLTSPHPRKTTQSSAGASPVTSKKGCLPDLVARRSRRDGKDGFFLVAASAADASKNKKNKMGKALPAAGEEKNGGAKPPTELDMAAAHRLYYAKGAPAAGGRRRSFLPYRTDLFGFSAHVNAVASTVTSSTFSPKFLLKFF